MQKNDRGRSSNLCQIGVPQGGSRENGAEPVLYKDYPFFFFVLMFSILIYYMVKIDRSNPYKTKALWNSQFFIYLYC